MVNKVLKIVLGMGLLWFLITRLIMQIDISKQEAWKLLDAIKNYVSDYTVAKPVTKLLDSVTKKLEKIVHE
ncbi:hypothetical protein EB001_11210 [bacterium]|nr:hypothetical protein [bacterium]